MKLERLNDDLLVTLCQYLLLDELIIFGYVCKLWNQISINPNSCLKLIVDKNSKYVNYILAYFWNNNKKAFRFANARTVKLLNCNILYDDRLTQIMHNTYTKIPKDCVPYNDFLKHFNRIKELHIRCRSSHLLQYLPKQTELCKLYITNIDTKFNFDVFLNKTICSYWMLEELCITYVNITKDVLCILSNCKNIVSFDITACIFDSDLVNEDNSNIVYNSFNKWNNLQMLFIANCDVLQLTGNETSNVVVNYNGKLYKIWYNMLKALIFKPSFKIWYFDLLECSDDMELYQFEAIPNKLDHLSISLTRNNMCFINSLFHYEANTIWIHKLSIVEHYLEFIECVPLLLFCRNKAENIVEFIDLHQSTFNIFCDKLFNEYTKNINNNSKMSKCKNKIKISVYVIYQDTFIETIINMIDIFEIMFSNIQIIGCVSSFHNQQTNNFKIDYLKINLINKPFRVYYNNWDVYIETL